MDGPHTGYPAPVSGPSGRLPLEALVSSAAVHAGAQDLSSLLCILLGACPGLGLLVRYLETLCNSEVSLCCLLQGLRQFTFRG